MSANWSLVLLLLVIAYAFWSFMRRRMPTKPNLEKVIGLLNDIRFNLRLIERQQQQPADNKKFKTYNWKAYREKLEFLNPELVRRLNTTFASILEHNAEVDRDKKNRVFIPRPIERVDELKQALIGIEGELVEWLKED